jgi:hypothetical protein
MRQYHFYLLIGLMAAFSTVEKWEAQRQAVEIIAACGAQ